MSAFFKNKGAFWPEISALGVFCNFDNERMHPPKYLSDPPGDLNSYMCPVAVRWLCVNANGGKHSIHFCHKDAFKLHKITFYLKNDRFDFVLTLFDCRGTCKHSNVNLLDHAVLFTCDPGALCMACMATELIVCPSRKWRTFSVSERGHVTSTRSRFIYIHAWPWTPSFAFKR